MADTVQSSVAQPEIEGQASGALIATLQTYIASTSLATNPERAAGYQDLLDAAEEFRIRLSNLDSQADSAVLTAVTNTLATI